MFERTDRNFFENTKTESCRNDEGLITAYRITPDDGYVIHTKFHNTPVYDENGIDTGEVEIGYTSSYIVILSDYDFESNPFDIYAVRKEETY
ncbi:MAG: hypothetical protein J6B23_09090 [Clostridia bacterium]|nr:hypothetical protein [Clostridia bacterium]